MNHRIPFRIQPMLATLIAEPFDKPGWVYEEKYDGDRILAYKEGARVLLLSRNGKDNTRRVVVLSQVNWEGTASGFGAIYGTSTFAGGPKAGLSVGPGVRS
jgi:ATP-dependent DNA ligase